MKTEIQDIVNTVKNEAVAMFGNKFREAILYGVCAQNGGELTESDPNVYNEEADVDIMILADVPHEEANAHLMKLLDSDKFDEIDRKYNKLVSVLVENDGFFRHWSAHMPFYGDVREKGIVIR